MTIDELKHLIDTAAGGSQVRFAHLIGRSPSQVNQWLSGKRAIGAKLDRDISLALGKRGPRGLLAQEAVTHIGPTPDGYHAFELLDVTASAGPGAAMIERPEVLQRLTVSDEWVRNELGGDVSRVKLISARGDSMSGTIENRDVLFVDCTVTEYQGEGVYVIAADGDVQVKRLQRTIGGGLSIISDNADRYPAQALTHAQAQAVTICGRVLAAWNLKKIG